MVSIRIGAAIGLVVVSFTISLDARSDQAAVAAPAKCVSIGKPKPNFGYTYRQTDSGGNSSTFTGRWEGFTKCVHTYPDGSVSATLQAIKQ